MQDLNALLGLAKEAAIAAGAEILRHYENYELMIKEDRSPLTSADLAANEAILQILEPSEIPVCSEERILQPENEKEPFWLVDPLDGTREFVKKNGQFCVCIALIENLRPVLGVIFIPLTNEIYFATKQDGFKFETLGERQNMDDLELKFTAENLEKIRAQSGKNLMFVSGETPTSKRIANALNLHEVRVGSAIKFCLLARGESGIYYRTHSSSIWDNAAGEILTAQTGATMLSLKTLNELAYSPKHLRCDKFIVIGSEFLPRKDEILGLIEKEGKI